MAFQFNRSRKAPMSEINVTPFVDVMLVLLIIFMVLSPLLIQGIEVNLPKTDTTKMSVSSEPLVISINGEGKYFINLGEEQLPISLVELKNKAKIIYQANPDIEIVFKSDAKVPFDYVAKGMASIQSLGIQKVGIITSGYDS